MAVLFLTQHHQDETSSKIDSELAVWSFVRPHSPLRMWAGSADEYVINVLCTQLLWDLLFYNGMTNSHLPVFTTECTFPLLNHFH